MRCTGRIGEGGQQNGRRAIADGRAVQEAQRGIYQARISHLRRCKLAILKHGVGIVARVVVGVDGKIGQGIRGQAVGVKIKLHQHRILAEQCLAVGHLAAGVQGLGQGGGGRLSAHFFHAYGHGKIDDAAGHGQVGDAQRGRSRCGGGAQLQRFNAGQSCLIRHQRGEMLLPLQLVAEHIAQVERLDAALVDFPRRLLYDQRAQLTQPALVPLVHRNLPTADNRHPSHTCLALVVPPASLPTTATRLIPASP